MARTLEEVAIQRLGQLTFSLIALETENERLRDELAALKRQGPPVRDATEKP